jgi:hypothetical protein
MRYISSKDHTVAQKYSLGIPIRKYRFHATDYNTSSLFPFVKVALILLLSILGIGVGLYLDISTTIEAHVEWMWPWMLAAVSVPTLFGLTLHRMGYKRLARFNATATILSFFLVTLCNSFFFAQSLPMHPVVYILIGLFLQCVGLIIFWAQYNAIAGLSSVLICTDGCLAISKMHRIHAVRWDCVTAFWDRKHNAKIVCDDGTKLTISYQWTNGIAARDQISGRVFRHIRARALSAYEAGETVAFGKFTVSQLGISNGKRLFPWDGVRECEYREDGVALIGNDDSYLDLVSSRALPNAVVFVSLVNAIVKSRVAQKMYVPPPLGRDKSGPYLLSQ